jgi:SWI/SNF-related matrix-associated actin-dependent regulator 1 of chromatin subfamily A
MITGQVDLQARGKAVQMFQNSPDVKVCLCTIGAGGEGITLTASHTCVFTDYAWNPAVNWQAEDRIHRIGQKESVLIIDLYCQNTIEDHLRAIIQSKTEMITEVVMKTVVEQMRSEL